MNNSLPQDHSLPLRYFSGAAYPEYPTVAVSLPWEAKKVAPVPQGFRLHRPHIDPPIQRKRNRKFALCVLLALGLMSVMCCPHVLQCIHRAFHNHHGHSHHVHHDGRGTREYYDPLDTLNGMFMSSGIEVVTAHQSLFRDDSRVRRSDGAQESFFVYQAGDPGSSITMFSITTFLFAPNGSDTKPISLFVAAEQDNSQWMDVTHLLTMLDGGMDDGFGWSKVQLQAEQGSVPACSRVKVELNGDEGNFRTQIGDVKMVLSDSTKTREVASVDSIVKPGALEAKDKIEIVEDGNVALQVMEGN